MSAKKKKSADVKDYRYDDKRKNNPPAGMASYEPAGEKQTRNYAYDPHLSPQLIWAEKPGLISIEVEDASGVEAETISLHVHERISTQAILKAVRKPVPKQMTLFADPQLPLKDAVQFYQHDIDWTNRLILGDSLLVANSLIEKELMAGKVQMIYMDPPYGVKYSSNFQPRIDQRDVKDKDNDLTREPEQIKAYRDTWKLGIHSYLTYMRDRLRICRELLTDSGSIFVQISDENVHLVRCLMDEVFGVENFCVLVAFSKTSGQTRTLLPVVNDFLLWYARDINHVKFRQIYQEKTLGEKGSTEYFNLELGNGETRRLTKEEMAKPSSLPKGSRVFATDSIVSEGFTPYGSQDIHLEYGEGVFVLKCGPKRHWKSGVEGIKRLWQVGRLIRREGVRIYSPSSPL